MPPGLRRHVLHRRHQQGRAGGVHGPDPEVARHERLVAGRLPQPVDRLEHLRHVRQQVLALPADPGTRAAAVEQRHAELALELAERLAERGLGQVQRLARPPQGAVPGDGGEVLQLLDAHAGSRCRSGGEGRTVQGFAVHPVDRSAGRDVRFALHLTI